MARNCRCLETKTRRLLSKQVSPGPELLFDPANAHLRSVSSRVHAYSAVAVAAIAGIIWPHATAALLGPVLVTGLLSLGVAHGACDHCVLPAYRQLRRSGWRYLLLFSAGYLGLAGATGLVWYCWPGLSAGLFFGLTVWHWGSADAPAHRQPGVWVAHSLLRGALLLAVPAWWWPMQTAHHVNGLLGLAGAAPIPTRWTGMLGPAVAGGHLVLWGYFAWHREFARGLRDAGEFLLLTGILVALPPLLALGVYFVFWHSWQHVRRLAPLVVSAEMNVANLSEAPLRELLLFGRKALPALVISLAMGAFAFILGGAARPLGEAWLALAVMGASVITLPHALLVTLVMDTAKWSPPGAFMEQPGNNNQ